METQNFKTTQSQVAGKVVLITGANRGIGKALLEEALKRGAKRVYAATRTPFTHPDKRVVPLILDVANPDQIREAVSKVESLDILINNAGVCLFDDLNNRNSLEQHMAVNFYGIYYMAQTFLPLLAKSKGAMVNNLSLVALAPLPPVASYAISKAAAHSLTQSLRLIWAKQGVRVHGIFTGPIDTDMNRPLDIPKAPPEHAAQSIFDGVENMEEDIFPDPVSQTFAEGWNNGVAKAFERQNAAFA
jgi:NAD(P)-dependent dehydrogenase (short-subunit alcohol dehydrogenase family)